MADYFLFKMTFHNSPLKRQKGLMIKATFQQKNLTTKNYLSIINGHIFTHCVTEHLMSISLFSIKRFYEY